MHVHKYTHQLLFKSLHAACLDVIFGTEEHLEGFVIIHEAFWGVHQSRIFLNAVLHKTNRIQARVYWDTELEGDLWLSTGTDVNSADTVTVEGFH